MIFLIIKMKIFNIQFLTNGAFALENFYFQFQRPLFSLVEDCLEGFERRGIGGGGRGSRGLRIIEPQEMMKIGREGNNPFEGWSFDLESGSSPLFTF